MGKRRWFKLPEGLRQEVIRLSRAGRSYREIVEELDVSVGSITGVLRPFGGVIRPSDWDPGSGRLDVDDRTAIKTGLSQGLSLRAIARDIGRAPSTVSREVKRNGGRGAYRPMHAHRSAQERARRPKPSKLESNPQLCAEVISGLERLWSPEQIERRLRIDFGDDPLMQVSHETIYKSLFVQGRGALRKELTSCLRTGRAVRRPRGRLERRGRIPDMVMISERPAEADDRAVPGHWEGDLIMGAGNRSAIGTLVERSTRYVMLLHLPSDHGAEAVRTAMTAKIATLPESLRRSLTWDQGSEMAQHARFSVETGLPVFFCDPHSPWQRGSNENTNGLLRQYFAKGTDLSVHSEADLDAAAASLNGRPRQTLDWMKPSERLAQLVAHTD